MGRKNELGRGQKDTTHFVDEPVTLYKRQETGNDIWHYRFKFNGRAIRRSAKTANLAEAKQVAKEAYYEARALIKHGFSPFTKTVSEVYKEFMQGIDAKIAIGKKHEQNKKYYKTTLKYWIEFLGNRQINNIKSTDISQYEQFRYTYWIRGPGATKQKPRSWKARPSDTTWQMELVALRTLFGFAVKKGYLTESQVPEIEIDRIKRNARPALTLREFRILGSVATQWVLWHGDNQNYRRKRDLFRHYFHIMVLSGMRVGEARDLRWRDITQHPREPDEIVIHVSGKTEDRELVPLRQAKWWLDRLRKRPFWAENAYKHDGPDDYVFCLPDGKPIKSFHGSFQKLCKLANITHDIRGRKFTIYSLRHTYATFQILYGGGADPITLAQNMRTSVKMLERYYVDLSSVLHSKRLSKLNDSSIRPRKRFLSPQKPDDEQGKLIPYQQRPKTA